VELVALRRVALRPATQGLRRDATPKGRRPLNADGVVAARQPPSTISGCPGIHPWPEIVLAKDRFPGRNGRVP